MKLIVPEKLKKGDLIGVVAPASPIIGDNIEEIQNAKKIIENLGYKVKFSENLFSNSQNYSASAKEKAKDIVLKAYSEDNQEFLDKELSKRFKNPENVQELHDLFE